MSEAAHGGAGRGGERRDEEARVDEARVAACAYALETVGFDVIEGYWSDARVDAMRAALAREIAALPARPGAASRQDPHHLHDLLCRDVAFAETLDDPRLDALLATQLGAHWIVYAYTTSTVPAEGANHGGRLHVDSPRSIPGYPTNVGVIWALDDFDERTGGTWLLPGSHHRADAPSEAYFERHAVQVRCRRGALVVFHARVWHRAGRNASSAPRHSLTMNACRPFMKQRLDWPRFVPASIADAVGPRARRALGFHARVPASLDEFFVDEADRLYRAGQE